MQTVVTERRQGFLGEMVQTVATALISLWLLKEVVTRGIHIEVMDWVQQQLSEPVVRETLAEVGRLLENQQSLPAIALIVVVAVVVTR